MRVNLFKSRPSSGSRRPKSGQQPSIRGKISAPIPIPNPMEDDEFPIRTGSVKATTFPDDEFPIRSPGARIVSTEPVAAPEVRQEEPIQPTTAGPSTGPSDAVPASVGEPEVAQEPVPDVSADSSRPESRPASPPEGEPVAVPEEPPEIASEAIPPDPATVPPRPQTPVLAPPSIPPPPVPPQELRQDLNSAPPSEPTSAPASEPVEDPQPNLSPPPAAAVAAPNPESPPRPAAATAPSPPRNSPPRASALTKGAPPVHRVSPPRRISPVRRVSPSRRASPSRRISPTRTAPPIRRTNPANTARFSAISATSTSRTGNSKDAAPQRKKSTLRSAFSRLFGRKKKMGSQTSSELSRMSGAPLSSQHRSDPSALNRVKEKGNEPKRSASLPITEFDRALRSHSVGPDDITTIEEVRNSIHGSITPSRRRAATTSSSRLFSHPRIHTGEWGLSPRPASTHGRGIPVQQQPTGSEDPSQIGMAITSDNSNNNNNGGGADRNRRRSRSLSDLHGVADGPGGGGSRRRSDEIRFWRESYDPGFMSPLSSNAAQEDMEDNDETGVLDLSMPDSPVVAERPPKTPPQPFNFGSITNEMVGMKITQAASIESRITGLETRMLNIEGLLEQLCPPGSRAGPMRQGVASSSSRHGQMPWPGSGDGPMAAYSSAAAPPMIPAIYQAISEDLKGHSLYSSSSQHSREDDGHSQISFGEAPTYIGSMYPPSSSATQAQSLTLTAGGGGHYPSSLLPTAFSPPMAGDPRPTSTSTVRGAASMPSIRRETSASSSQDHQNQQQQQQFAALQSQLEAERAARQTLDAQVKKLSDRLNVLSSTLFTMVRDPQKSKSQERLPGINIHNSSSNTGAGAPSPANIPNLPPTPAFAAGSHKSAAGSVFETDDETDDDRSRLARRRAAGLAGSDAATGKFVRESGETEEDEDFSEAFQTPREERPQLYGAFGEELKEEDADGKRKKAARTLSLSQLTLGKGVVPSI